VKWNGGLAICVDAATLLGGIESGSVDVVILDPPFNLRKQYGFFGRSKDNQVPLSTLLF
jgi:hypothetical protein